MPRPSVFQFVSEKDIAGLKKATLSKLFVKPILKYYDEDTLTLSAEGQTVMAELVWHVALKNVSPVDLAVMLINSEIFSASGDPGQMPDSDSTTNRTINMARWLLDTIWTINHEFDMIRVSINNLAEKNEDIDPGKELDDAEERSANLSTLVRSLTVLENGSRTIFYNLALEQLSLTMLREAKLIGSEKELRSKLIKKRTARYFIQQKYNLLGEESEGFAKVITTLNQAASQFVTTTAQNDCTMPENKNNNNMLSERIKSLIGYFNLEPNRTCDLVFEALENSLGRRETMMTKISPNILALLQVLQLFRRSTVCHVLGRRFHIEYEGLSDSESLAADEKDDNVSRKTMLPARRMSLCRVAALLVAAGQIDIDNLFPHLQPHEKEIRKFRQLQETHILAKSGKIGKVKLGASKEERELEEKKNLEIENQLKEDFQIFSTANQKYGILCGLYDLYAWNVSKSYVKRMEDCGGKPLSDVNVILHLCNMGRNVLASLYRKLPQHLYPGNLVLTARKHHGIGMYNALSSDTLPFTTYPSCANLKSAASQIGPIVNRLGEQVGQDKIFYIRLCRVLAYSIGEENSLNDPKEKKWTLAMLERCLVPAISIVHGNLGAVSALWKVLCLIPYNLRYKMYAQWKTSAYLKKISLVHAASEAKNSTKLIMRRLAKENVITQGIKLAKIALSNPLVVFGTIIDQIEIYDNMIAPVVESFKYMSPLAHKLTSSREKLKADGTNVSSWLQSLSLFTGTYFRRYPFAEHRGILQYVIHSLESTNTVDSVNLIVLKELVGSMSGIVIMEDVSKAQLEGRAGGPELIFQSSMFKEMEGSIEKSKRYLAESLMSTPLVASGKKEAFAISLLVLIAKKLGQIAYATKVKELKLIGNLYDQCYMTLLQLVEFYTTSKSEVRGIYTENSKLNVSRSDEWYVQALPSIETLSNTYLLNPGVAFSLAKPVFKVLSMLDHSNSRLKKNSILTAQVNDTWGWKALSSRTKSLLTDGVWKHISVELYLEFWRMNIYDLYFPKKRYELELKRVQQECEMVRKESKCSALQRKRRIRKKEEVIRKLKSEMKSQEKHVKDSIESLRNKETKWIFGSGDNTKIIEMFVQHCLVPRILQGPEDAFYCSQFAQRLHASDTANWPSLYYYNFVLTTIPVMVHSSTEREAASIGLFLCETLAPLRKWCDAEEFKKSCSNKSGFLMDYTNSESNVADLKQYCKAFKAWNKRLTNLFSSALQCKVYLTVRNTLLVLSKVVDEYPNDKKTMTKICDIMKQLIEKEEKEDVKTVAKQYSVMLQKRKREDPSLDANPPKPKVVKKRFEFGNDDQKIEDLNVINNDGDKKGLKKELMSADAKEFTPSKDVATSKSRHGSSEGTGNNELGPPRSFYAQSRKRKRWSEGQSEDSESNNKESKAKKARWEDNSANVGRRWGSDDTQKNTSNFVKNNQNGNRRDKVVHERRRDSGNYDRREVNRERLPPRSSSNMSQSQRWIERERNKQQSLPKPNSSQPVPTRPPSQGLNRGRNDGSRPPSQASNRGRGDDSRRWSANEPGSGYSNLGRPKDNARDSRTKQPPLRFDNKSGKETRNINKRYTEKGFKSERVASQLKRTHDGANGSSIRGKRNRDGTLIGSGKSRQTNDSHSQRSRAQKKPSGTFDKRRNKNSSNGRDRHNNVRNSRNSSRR